MNETGFGMATLVAGLHAARDEARDEADVLARVRMLAQRAAARRHERLRPDMCRPDTVQGFGICVLHEEADPQLEVFVASWLAGRGTPPHHPREQR